jgi:hypothetical protein
MTSHIENTPKNDNEWIPDGFVLINGPDNERYVVPEYMVPALHQTFDAKKKKEELDVCNAMGSVSGFCPLY